ncbi:PepSY domain-containing protein [Spiribacter onubensis]|uniref:PepSY domain-containing protein n=1 Tax=Spiribacter onubensis TaxID=3122420 RepID=A0ABV3S9D2_9GAMM
MNRNRMIPGLVGGLAAAVLLSAGIAIADGDDRHDRDDDMPRDGWMSLVEVAGQLESQGYTPYEIEIDDGAYEVTMVDEQGMVIETYIDPTNGEPLPRRWDD